MRLAIASFLIVSAIIAASAFGRQQVLKNGSFETLSPDPEAPPNLPEFWTEFGGAGRSGNFASDRQFSALASVRVNGFVGMYRDTVSIGEDVRVLMKAQARHPAAAPISGNIVAGIKLEFDPPEGLEIPPPEENLAFDQTAPVDTWVQVTYSTVVPPDIDLAKIVVISFDNTAANGAVYADDARAEFGSQPGVNQLGCDGFECGSSGADGMNPPWDEFADALSGARKNCFNPPAHSGSCTLRMSGPLTAGVAQQIAVTPGDTLTISAWFLSLSSAPYQHPDARAGVKVEWSAGNVPTVDIDIAPNSNPISGTTNIINSATPTDQWTPVTIDYTMPPDNAALLRATLITGFGPGTCDVYFDAFEMVLTNVFNGSDADGDDDEDMLDIRQLQEVFRGSGGGLPFGGLVFDHNEDNDVDSGDLNQILPQMTGPAQVP
jgi:hypothetical protein